MAWSTGKPAPVLLDPATAAVVKRFGEEMADVSSPDLAAHLRIGQVTAIDTATVTATVAYGAGTSLTAIAGHHWLKGLEPQVNDYVQVLSQDSDNWIVGTLATTMRASVGAKVITPSSTASFFTSGSDTAVTWSAEVRDDGGLWSAGASTRLTVPSGYGGWWKVGGRIHFSGNAGASPAGGYRFAVTVKMNGSNKGRNQVHDTITGGGTYTAGWIVPVDDLLYAAAGDYFELFGFQDSGTSMSILTTVGEASNSFHAYYLGP